LLIFGVLATLIAGGVFYYQTMSTSQKIDKNTFCPTNGPKEILVVLIDRTDDLETVQREALRRHLEDLREEIPRNGLLEIYSVGPIGKDLIRPEFKLCNPGHGQAINELIESPGRAERRWKLSFQGPLDRVLGDMLAPGEANSSPIMESIQSISVSSFSGEAISKIPKRLIIVSDMLQFTNGYSQYNGDVSFENFKKGPYFLKVRSNLEDVEIELLYVRRPSANRLQGRTHIEFWQKYFTNQGAILARVRSLTG
jgi:hypothetical protein